jgi:hypothetical protein
MENLIMKTKLLLSYLVLLTSMCTAQNSVNITFEDSSIYNYHIEIDTITFPTNKWQIGTPSKTIFNQSLSLSNAIVTDTLNNLPASDTSVFILKAYNPFFFPVPTYVLARMSFYYKMNKDSSDLVMVEVAADTGMHWVNMLDEDTTYNIVWYGNKPNFADTSTNWKFFNSNFSQWFSAPYSSSLYPYYADADTFRFRFTYISSPTSTNKEGWMIDNLNFDFSTPEKVTSESKLEASTLFCPNPARNMIKLNREFDLKAENESIHIYASDGKCVHQQNVEKLKEIQIDLKPGLYFLIYRSGTKQHTQKILIE